MVFAGTISHSALSHIYRDLYCEHHFIQKEPIDKPSIPALTPIGFQIWMTHIIRAYPEEESQRFVKVLQQYAINNAEDRKERFPKQLPRCMFPKTSHRSSRHDIEDSILVNPDLRAFARPRPPDVPPPAMAVPPQPTSVPRAAQQQYPAQPSSTSDGHSEERGSRMQSTDRERKGYPASSNVPPPRSHDGDVPAYRSQSNNNGARLGDDDGRTRRPRSDSNTSHGLASVRRGGVSPGRRDEGEELSRTTSSRDERRSRHGMPPGGSGPAHEDEHRRSGGYQYPPPPPPRYQ